MKDKDRIIDNSKVANPEKEDEIIDDWVNSFGGKPDHGVINSEKDDDWKSQESQGFLQKALTKLEQRKLTHL